MTDNAKPPLLDRAIGKLSPAWALKRAQARADLDVLPQMQAVYRGALPTRNDTPWATTIGYQGANAPLNRWRLTQLRDRARELERNNAIAKGMLDRAVENVIGHGMRLQPTTADAGFNEQVETLWNDWTRYADVTGQRSWTDFQRLIFRSELRDGDVGIAFVQRGRDYKLQAIEGDQIDTLRGGYDLAKNIVDGIQFNDRGRPIAYNIVGVSLNGQRSESVVSANDFVFLARLNRLYQWRGEPCFAQAFTLFDQIDGIIEAVTIAVRVAACQAMMIKRNNAGRQFGGLPTAANQQNNQQRILTVEPGQVQYLQPDEDIAQFTPTQPQHNFPDFIASLLRIAGVTLGLPLELVLLDFSRTNYSSARASLLQAYRAFKSMQQTFCDMFMSRVYQWRVSKWVKDGLLDVPAGLEQSFWRHRWIAPGWAWVDPVKEIQAAQMEIDANLNTLAGIAAAHGMDFAEIVDQRRREVAALDAAKIPVTRSNMTRDPMAPAALNPDGTPAAQPAKAPAPKAPTTPADDSSVEDGAAGGVEGDE